MNGEEKNVSRGDHAFAHMELHYEQEVYVPPLPIPQQEDPAVKAGAPPSTSWVCSVESCSSFRRAMVSLSNESFEVSVFFFMIKID